MNTSLAEIDLNRNNIGDEGVALGEALRVNTSLTQIS